MPLKPAYRSSEQVLQTMVHDLGQPLSALQCSLEVALLKPRTAADYEQVIESALQISEDLREQLEHCRDLAVALEPCDRMQSINLERALVLAMEPIRDLAESIGVEMTWECKSCLVSGNPQKLSFGLSRLIAWLLAGQADATLHILADEIAVAELRLKAGHSAPALPRKPELRIVAETALEAAGARLRVDELRSVLSAEVRVPALSTAQGITSVILGEF